MKAYSWLCAATLSCAFGFAGCSSPESRSNETAAVSRSATSGPHPQPRPAREKARIGDTQEMVQSAMGNPDEKRDVTDVDGHQSIWIYKNYFQQPGRVEQTGWSEVLVPAVHDQYGNVVQKPVTQDIYRTQVIADIQVSFTRGVVSSVEQLRH